MAVGMRARALFLVLLFSFLLALPAAAQDLAEFRPDNNFQEALANNPGQAKPQESFPFIAVSLGLLVLLFAAPFAIQYFGEMSKEMRDAQKGAPFFKPKR